jgi:uncharacterized membrane protein YphA (DoxX/SURF4 family)
VTVLLWILQIVLALAFGAAGVIKLSQPKEKLAGTMAWTEDFSATNVKTIGGLELLAAIGLILPWATGIAPTLTPLAALGLVAIQVGAMITHYRRKEMQMIPINAVLALLALLVAIGRF